jgi:DNA-binding transcriptional LysR family regulator
MLGDKVLGQGFSGAVMELRHLRYFHAVAEELHFGRAAMRLNISQPPLSRQIHQLEVELGVVLFDRKPTGIVLTAPGQILLEGTRELLMQLDRVCRQAQRAAKGEVGKLTVGVRETAMYNGVLPAILHAYRDEFKNVELEIMPLASVEQIEALRIGQLDVGFVHNSYADQHNMQSEEVYVDNIVLALHSANPLARRRRLRLSDLSGEPLIWFPRLTSPRYHDELLQACQKAGMTMNIVQLVPYVGGTALTLVSAGVGISFAQESSARMTKPINVTLRPIDDLDLKARLSVTWRQDNTSPLLASFLDVVRRMRGEFRNPPGAPGKLPGANAKVHHFGANCRT